MPKSIYQASQLLPTDFLAIFSQAHFYLNPAKTNIEVSKNILSEESVKLCLVTLNIIISYIFPENVTEIY